MTRWLIPVAALLAGCATMQVSTPGRAVIAAVDTHYDAVYTAAMRAAMDADFVVKDSDRDAGFIYAVKGANPLITETKHLQLSIQVRELDGEYMVDVKSNLTGELVALGATKKVMEQYCAALATLLPDAAITIDGKAWSA